MTDEDFDGFFTALPDMAVMACSEDMRRKFAHQYRSEIVALLGWLQRLNLAGGPGYLHPSPPQHCDEFGGEISASSFFVD